MCSTAQSANTWDHHYVRHWCYLLQSCSQQFCLDSAISTERDTVVFVAHQMWSVVISPWVMARDLFMVTVGNAQDLPGCYWCKQQQICCQGLVQAAAWCPLWLGSRPVLSRLSTGPTWWTCLRWIRCSAGQRSGRTQTRQTGGLPESTVGEQPTTVHLIHRATRYMFKMKLHFCHIDPQPLSVYLDVFMKCTLFQLCFFKTVFLNYYINM